MDAKLTKRIIYTPVLLVCITQIRVLGSLYNKVAGALQEDFDLVLRARQDLDIKAAFSDKKAAYTRDRKKGGEESGTLPEKG